jgi:hypothetical protein
MRREYVWEKAYPISLAIVSQTIAQTALRFLLYSLLKMFQRRSGLLLRHTLKAIIISRSQSQGLCALYKVAVVSAQILFFEIIFSVSRLVFGRREMI